MPEINQLDIMIKQIQSLLSGNTDQDQIPKARALMESLRDSTHEAMIEDAENSTALLIELLDIAECSEAGDDARELCDFVVTALSAIESYLSDGIDPSTLRDFRYTARERWGDYLEIMGDRHGDSLSETLRENDHEDEALTADPKELKHLLECLAMHDDESVEFQYSGDSSDEPPSDELFSESGERPTSPPDPPTIRSQDIDPELLDAYMEDAQRCLASIEQSVLAFEHEPENQNNLRQLCRDLHTIKGASATIGLSDLATYLHQVEDYVQASCIDSSGEADVEAVLKTVDTVRAQVMNLGASGAQAETPNSKNESSTQGSSFNSSVDTSSGNEHEETVRVEASRLDRLMDMLAELVILRNRRDTRIIQFKELHGELSRCVGRLRFFGDNIESLAPQPTGYGESSSGTPFSERLLIEFGNDVSEFSRTLRDIYEPLAEENLTISRLIGQFRQELLELRRLPVTGLFKRLQRGARDAARAESRKVKLELIGEHSRLERSLQERLYEPLLHIVRNAVSHGIEDADRRIESGKDPVGKITLEAQGDATSLILEVRDDGRGLDFEALKARGTELGMLSPGQTVSKNQLAQLIFRPGFSTRKEVNEISGRGVGMDVVLNSLERLRSQVEVESVPGEGTTIRMRIPLRSVIEHAMVFRVDGQLFALPMQFVQSAQTTSSPQKLSNSDFPVASMRKVLGLNATAPPAHQHLLIVGPGTRSTSSSTNDLLALSVDAILGPEEVVVRSLPAVLKQNRLFAGAALSGGGEIVLMLDGRTLADFARQNGEEPVEEHTHQSGHDTTFIDIQMPRALVVDDSISVRRFTSKILRSYGVLVTEAADGLEAMNSLRTSQFDLVITDLDMPRMGGIELLSEIKRNSRWSETAVIVASSRCAAKTQDQVKEMGAISYIVKPVSESTLGRLLVQIGIRANYT